MTKIERILVPTDFSKHAEKALEIAISFAKEWAAAIDLFHVIQWPTHYSYPTESELYLDLRRQAHDAAAQRLAEMARAMEEQGIRVVTHIEEGIAAQEIVEAASKFKSGLIVLGTRGMSGLKHHLLGSVAERTVRLASCPVLTVSARTEQPA